MKFVGTICLKEDGKLYHFYDWCEARPLGCGGKIYTYRKSDNRVRIVSDLGVTSVIWF